MEKNRELSVDVDKDVFGVTFFVESKQISDVLVSRLMDYNIDYFVVSKVVENQSTAIFLTSKNKDELSELVAGLTQDNEAIPSEITPPLIEVKVSGYVPAGTTKMYESVFDILAKNDLSIMAQSVAGCRMSFLFEKEHVDLDIRKLLLKALL